MFDQAADCRAILLSDPFGGGFSIGLGGLGFVMGISASWLLFTGLVGAWVAAVILVPRVKAVGDIHRHRSFPDYSNLYSSSSLGVGKSEVALDCTFGIDRNFGFLDAIAWVPGLKRIFPRRHVID